MRCDSSGARCSAPKQLRSYHRTKAAGLSWVDESIQCTSCNGGWVVRLDEPEVKVV